MAKNLRENIIYQKISAITLFNQGFIAGIGWAFGVTIGFILVSTLLAFILSRLGGLPLIGDWIASVVTATLNQLSFRTPGLPK